MSRSGHPALHRVHSGVAARYGDFGGNGQKAQAQLLLHGDRECAVESGADVFGVAVPVSEAAAAGLEPGGQVGVN
jgi:hypothetical protein